jgi:hypothetical protein
MTALATLLAVAAASTAQPPPRQIDAPVLENSFLRAHIVTLNTVEHYRSIVDGPQVVYCLGSFAVARSGGEERAIERCRPNQLVFHSSGWLDFKADGDARPEMLIVEIKHRPAGDFFVTRDDATRVAPDVYRVVLENEAVRVVEVHLEALRRTASYRQVGRTLEWPLTSARVRVTRTGATQNLAVVAREPRWTADAMEQAVENTGMNDLRAILIELK